MTGRDFQPEGALCEGRTVVRSVFAVYHDDEQEGALLLLELMETLRIALLRKVIIGDQIELDLQEGLEMLTYPENTAPYFAGEMISTWKILFHYGVEFSLIHAALPQKLIAMLHLFRGSGEPIISRIASSMPQVSQM